MAYYNYPYLQYPYGYQQNQSYSNNNFKSMEWVDGEIGARAFQMPQGWPPETPIVLWDNTDKKIYLKSWNQAGAPKPIQELDYEIKENNNQYALPGTSGADMSQYVTKDDINQLKQEIKNMISALPNNNNNNQNRGNNR